jgi:hypothetical protein
MLRDQRHLPSRREEGDNADVANTLEPRRRSTLSKLDDWLLVVVVAVAAVFALQIISWLIGTVFFLVKVAVVAAVIGLVIAYFNRRA